MIICRVEDCKHNEDGFCGKDNVYIENKIVGCSWYDVPICTDYESNEEVSENDD